MSNYDPFNPISRNHQEAFDSRYSSQGEVSVWPIVAVIALLLAAGFVISL